jgi:A/G-specific adenine glycosylase
LTKPLRRALLAWYDASRRDLPWRRTNDFYPIWLSEVMLQQTRVEAAIPYFNRFLDRFPTVAALAGAAEGDVLTAWSGLGYYSRARNLLRAARTIVAEGYPVGYEEILALPGIGPYTAAAIASISLGAPRAAVDGNVLRVVSRLRNDASEISLPAVRAHFTAEAQSLLDTRRPGDFNQAMMELGATVCVPRNPLCGQCPVQRFCEGRAAGRERELPVKQGKERARDVELELLLITRGAEIFLVRRSAKERRLAGFWELPQRQSPASGEKPVATFTHRIVNDCFRVTIYTRKSSTPPVPAAGEWFTPDRMAQAPVTTITRKALAFAERLKDSSGSAK